MVLNLLPFAAVSLAIASLQAGVLPSIMHNALL
jgi:hypothetical protein